MKARGPKTARVLWVGEAPGYDEVALDTPFVGASGQFTTKLLRKAGIDVDNDVRFTNAVRHNPGKFPDGAAGGRLIAADAPYLDAEIAEMRRLKVIVACGGVALRRLTDESEINQWRGSVIRPAGDISAVLNFGVDAGHLQKWPHDAMVVPVLHPSGVLQSGSRDPELLLRRDIRKISSILQGTLEHYDIITHFNPPPAAVLRAAKNAKWCYFDTEFHRYTKAVYWVGMTFDGINVYGMPWDHRYAGVISEILENKNILKGAHNIHADAEVMQKCGVKILGNWWDSMVGFHCLHPSRQIKYGLAPTAAFYLGDVCNWKNMAHDDPYYNAKDVIYGAQCMLKEWEETRAREVPLEAEATARMVLVKETYKMERDGLLVDRALQKRLLEELNGSIKKQWNSVTTAVAEVWLKRVIKSEDVLRTLEARYTDLKSTGRHATCSKHPRNSMLGKATPRCSTCSAAWGAENADAKRKSYVEIQKRVGKQRLETRKFADGGFNARSSAHLKWLLYSPDALHLPIVRKGGRYGKVTTGADAIDKLARSSKVLSAPDKYRVVFTIKDVQHLSKAKSTFVALERKDSKTHEMVSFIDENNYAHPPYKVHGTETGRLAGGSDIDEKADNRFAFNALNIPKKWRRLYVAPPRHVLVASDWRNVEGRLTAHFCKDPNYTRALRGELTGGPKVHSINAGIIYGIEPQDAKDHLVRLGGQQKPAYDAGKRLTHAWSYGMGLKTMCKHFDIIYAEAKRIDEALTAAYPVLVAWRKRLITQVLGVWERLPGYRYPLCTLAGTRFLANPFGWQKHFLGMGYAQKNQVLAFLPQSTGAGLFTRVAPLLSEQYPIFTGTYDSFVLVVPKEETRSACEFIQRVMEREWPELDNKTFPAEVSVGLNWGDYNDNDAHGAINLTGLREVA